MVPLVRSCITTGDTFIADLVCLVDHGDGDDEPPVQSGYGLSVWSRVANTLTVSVSKAWASNITAHSGERASYLLSFAMTTNYTYSMFAMQRRHQVKSHISHGP